MITRISDLTESPELYNAKFKNTKKKPDRFSCKTFNDCVHLSAESIRKASIDPKHLQKADELQNSQTFIEGQQRDNIEKLIADLKAIKEKSKITEEQKEILKNDFESALQDVRKPDQETLDRLMDDISEIISDGRLDGRELRILKNDVNALLNSANLSDEELDILKVDFQNIIESSNINQEDLETLRADIMQIKNTAEIGSN